MWKVYAFASAFFAGIVSILAKIGINNVNSNLATALRTVVVAVFAWLMVFVVGSQTQISSIDTRSLTFLTLSGLATGASWLCYFKALQVGSVSKVVPVDKSSTLLTMLFAFIFLGEELTIVKVLAMALIGTGTYLMVGTRTAEKDDVKSYRWLPYAILSAVFASLTAILGKIGIVGVEANLGTAIRTVVVLVMAWLIVVMQGKQQEISKIDRKSWAFLTLSGFATGLSWLAFYRALQEGPASIVVPIDKLSIIITVAFGFIVLREELKKKSVLGLLLIVAGTLSLLVF